MSALTTREALAKALRDVMPSVIDRSALAATSKAAVTWGMPLLDILNSEGHDHECDAVTSENLTLCDCWWGRVKQAAEAMSTVATLADEALGDQQYDAVADVGDHLIASGAVVDAATLADDEALVERVALGTLDPSAQMDDYTRDRQDLILRRTRHALRALAAALTERGGERG